MHASAYRPDIDGLRAVAVGLVVVYHALPTLLTGGFVGVDVFFVISGFLITGIILDQLQAGRFSFLDFYRRRIRRLFPALIVVLAFCLACGWVVLLPDELASLGRHVGAGAIYISNIVLRREAGYFDAAAEAKPLLHLWSLAVEEQFYIVWPVLLAVIVGRRRAGWLGWTLALLIVGSFVYNVRLVGFRPDYAFFLLVPRAWELLLGAALAYAHRKGHLDTGHAPAAGGSGRSLVSATGLGLIAVAVTLLDKRSAFPGWWALLPTVGTVLIVAAGPCAWLNRVVLSSRAMVAVGLVSYPLYLWHWPLLSFAHIAGGGVAPEPTVRAALVGLAAVLAVATYVLVEKPLRGRATPAVAVGLLGICLGLGLAGLAVMTKVVPAYSARFGVERIVEAAGEWEVPKGPERLRIGEHDVWRTAGAGSAVLVYGDSHAQQYWSRAKAHAATSSGIDRPILFVTRGGCAPIPGSMRTDSRLCGSLTEAVEVVLARFPVDTIVVTGAWWSAFESREQQIGGEPFAETAGRDRAVAALGAAIGRWVAAGRRVYVVLNIPIGRELDPRSQIARSLFHFEVRRLGVSRDHLLARHGEINRRLAEVARGAGAKVIDPLEILCDSRGWCPATDTGGTPIYKDATHLRPSFVRDHVRYLDEAFAAR
jgi:peptidoglycan/LPS O-acetylase OafA/YrhL